MLHLIWASSWPPIISFAQNANHYSFYQGWFPLNSDLQKEILLHQQDFDWNFHPKIYNQIYTKSVKKKNNTCSIHWYFYVKYFCFAFLKSISPKNCIIFKKKIIFAGEKTHNVLSVENFTQVQKVLHKSCDVHIYIFKYIRTR